MKCRDSPVVTRCQRPTVVLFVSLYVGATLWFAARHAIGDTGTHPISYFFTWDMFPFYYCESVRRVAVVETASGEHRQLVPGALQQYRAGVHGDLTRVELERGGLCYRRTAEQSLNTTPGAPGADPIVRVLLYEQFWPVKFNYPPDLYRDVTGGVRPDRKYWRLREQFPVPTSPVAPTDEAAP